MQLDNETVCDLLLNAELNTSAIDALWPVTLTLLCPHSQSRDVYEETQQIYVRFICLTGGQE